MSTVLFALAGLAALLMFIFALIGCIEMRLPREPARTKSEASLCFLEAVLLQGAVWEIQSFRKNWKVKHRARRMLYWAFALLGACLLFCGLSILIEVSRL